MKTLRAPGMAEPMEGGNMTHLRKLGAMAVALLLALLAGGVLIRRRNRSIARPRG